jgi:hypothetical protein
MEALLRRRREIPSAPGSARLPINIGPFIIRRLWWFTRHSEVGPEGADLTYTRRQFLLRRWQAASASAGKPGTATSVSAPIRYRFRASEFFMRAHPPAWADPDYQNAVLERPPGGATIRAIVAPSLRGSPLAHPVPQRPAERAGRCAARASGLRQPGVRPHRAVNGGGTYQEITFFFLDHPEDALQPDAWRLG